MSQFGLAGEILDSKTDQSLHQYKLFISILLGYQGK